MGISITGPNPRLEGFLVPLRRTPDGLDTGLAFQGSGEGGQRLELTLRDASGELIHGPLSIPLPETGYTAHFVSELFEGAVPADFKGTVSVRTTGGKVAVLVLELNAARGWFASVAVTAQP